MNSNFNLFLLVVSIFLFVSHITSSLMKRLNQPRVVGEICVGLILGPSLLGLFWPTMFQTLFNSTLVSSLEIIKDLGLILLMFCSGYELRNLDPKKNLKACLYGASFGAGIPVLFGYILFSYVDVSRFLGAINSIEKVKVILILSMAVTSIPVISRIFLDLDMMKKDFSKLVISIALIQDLVIYAVLNTVLSSTISSQEMTYQAIASHLIISTIFLGIILYFRTQLYSLARWVGKFFISYSVDMYVSFILALTFTMVYLLSHIGVTPMISAFCCGMVVGATQSELVEEANNIIKQFSFSMFIPIYFIMAGWKINLVSDFSVWILVLFLSLSSFFKILGGYIAGRYFIKDSKLFALSLGVTLNARGGPGIVIAMISFDQKIINGLLFTTLVLTSLLTSSLAGSVLKKVRIKLS